MSDSDRLTKSKRVLYEVVKPSVRFKGKRGANRSAEHVKEIIEIFLTHNAEQVPKFVAHDLAQLPPYDVSSVDVLYLSRQIITMKEDISNLVSNQRSLLGLVQTNAQSVEVMNPTSAPVVDIPNTPNIFSNTAQYIVHDETVCDSSTLSSVGTPFTDSSDEGVDVYSDIEESTFGDLQDMEALNLEVSSKSTASPKWYKSTKKNSNQKRPYIDQVDINQVVVGNGSYRDLRAANMKFGVVRQNVIKSNMNQSVSGIFVSRLSPQTTVRQISLHIKRETGFNVRPERLPVKRDSLYSSWYIRAENRCREDLFSAHLWPKGTIIKPYFT